MPARRPMVTRRNDPIACKNHRRYENGYFTHRPQSPHRRRRHRAEAHGVGNCYACPGRGIHAGVCGLPSRLFDFVVARLAGRQGVRCRDHLLDLCSPGREGRTALPLSCLRAGASRSPKRKHRSRGSDIRDRWLEMPRAWPARDGRDREPKGRSSLEAVVEWALSRPAQRPSGLPRPLAEEIEITDPIDRLAAFVGSFVDRDNGPGLPEPLLDAPQGRELFAFRSSKGPCGHFDLYPVQT